MNINMDSGLIVKGS